MCCCNCLQFWHQLSVLNLNLIGQTLNRNTGIFFCCSHMGSLLKNKHLKFPNIFEGSDMIFIVFSCCFYASASLVLCCWQMLLLFTLCWLRRLSSGGERGKTAEPPSGLRLQQRLGTGPRRSTWDQDGLAGGWLPGVLLQWCSVVPTD